MSSSRLVPSTIRIVVFLGMLISIQGFSQSRFELVPTQSQLKWKGSLVMGGSHEGTITLAAGKLMTDAAGQLLKGDVEVNMNSIKSSDVKPARSAQELEDHLKSKDFFDTERFPKAFFSILKITPAATFPNQEKYTVTGMLMIKGIGNQITFPCSISIINGIAKVKGDLEFNRTKWDITYHAAGFFGTVKNEIISDQIKILLDLTLAIKK